MAALREHHWPGNVRELRNLVEATLAMGEPPPLGTAPSGDRRATRSRRLAQSYSDARDSRS